MNSDIQGLNDIIHSTFKNLKVQDLDKANTVTDLWSSVLKNINSTGSKSNPNEGQNLADHSRVIDLKNGVLLVEADHPGWISLLQMHQKFIIRGMNMKSPDLKISTLAFRLKGNRGTLGDVKTDSVEKIKEDMSKKLDKEKNLKSKMILQIHDELVIDTKKDELDEIKEILKTTMENTYKLNVPLKVDINIGENLYEAK